MGRRRWRGEGGQATAEYAGIIVVAVVLITTLLVAFTPIAQKLTCEIGNQISSLFGGQTSSCASSSDSGNKYDIDRSSLPASSVERSSQTQVGVNVKVVSVDGTDGKSTASTTYADGSGSRSATSTQELAVGVTFDAEAPGGKNNPVDAKVEAKVQGKGTRTTTRTWNCGGAGERSCADFDAANSDAAESHLDNQGMGRFGNTNEQYDTRPDSTSESWKGTLALEAQASTDFDVDPDGKNSTDGEDGESDEPSLGVGASIKVGGEVSYTHTTNKDAEGNVTSTSRSFGYKGEAGAEAHVSAQVSEDAFGLQAQAGGTRSYAGTYETTYDAEGNLQTITFTSTAEGTRSASAEATLDAGNNAPDKGPTKDDNAKGTDQGDKTVTTTVTTTLDVSKLSPEQKQIAQSYVDGQLTNGALTVPQAALNPNKPSTNAFDNLLYEEATVSRTTQNGSKITEQGGIDLWVANYSTQDTTSTSETASAEQLGAPGPDGTRTYENVEVP